MNTKIMLALCAMIAGCTSVSAVEPSAFDRFFLADSSRANDPQVLHSVPPSIRESFEEMKGKASEIKQKIQNNYYLEDLCFLSSFPGGYNNNKFNLLKNKCVESLEELDKDIDDVKNAYSVVISVMDRLFVTGDASTNYYGKGKVTGIQYLQKKGSESMEAIMQELKNLQRDIFFSALDAVAKDCGTTMKELRSYLSNQFKSGLIPEDFSVIPNKLFTAIQNGYTDGELIPTKVVKVYEKEIENKKSALINIFDRIANV